MAVVHDRDVLFDRLDEELRMASQPTPELFAKIITKVCSRLPLLRQSRRDLVRLIEAGAWTDSALVLVELELPLWKVRRVAYESGEWLCSLSRAPNLPVKFDDSIDTSHTVLVLAILRAIVEARRGRNAEYQPAANVTQSLPPFVSASGDAICCDNFA